MRAGTWFWILPVLALGCGDDAGGGKDAAAPNAPPVMDGAVPCPPSLPEFVVGENIGLTAEGRNGAASARILEASEIPPITHENTWTIAVTDAEGSPLPDAELLSVCSFMPAHGHFLGLTRDEIRAQSKAGPYELDLFFNMGGPWEVQVALQSPSLPDEPAEDTSCAKGRTGNDYIAFEFCVVN